MCNSGHRRIAWYNSINLLAQRPPEPVRAMLAVQGSLTQYLKRHVVSLQFRLCNQQWSSTLLEEERLQLSSRVTAKALVRETLFSQEDQPIVFARSVFPSTPNRELAFILQSYVGSMPLGQFLHKRLKWQKRNMEFALLQNPNNTLYHRISMHLSYTPSSLWMRRSLLKAYNIQDAFLLVEAFPWR